MKPESPAGYFLRQELTADEWHQHELGAARERISRQGESTGPGKRAGTSALVLTRAENACAPDPRQLPCSCNGAEHEPTWGCPAYPFDAPAQEKLRNAQEEQARFEALRSSMATPQPAVAFLTVDRGPADAPAFSGVRAPTTERMPEKLRVRIEYAVARKV